MMQRITLECKTGKSTGKHPFRLTKIGFLFLISLMTGACTQAQKVQEQPQEFAGEQALSTFTVPIEGMSCGACVSNVKKTLRSMEGVKEVEVSLENRQAKVSYANELVSPEQVRQAINAIGYKAGKPVEEKQP